MKNFRRKFEGVSFANVQQIVVTRGNLKLLIENPQDNTGSCHYFTFVRKTSVVGSNKGVLKAMR